MRLENRLDRFLFRRIDERAGIHDQHIRLLRVGGDLHAAAAERFRA